ncbi:hypothetical protein B0H14DRAFT_3491976 [Mycena olivaceomarginata]|nr:hypothetical protein B0H14DRAFT_3491976 [Mycena olivaceomarginata]
MHSAGEKQFYVIALVETLFQHIPHDIVVGLLYDVACSAERSCVKWGFLDRFMGRIAWAVSIFHAFGHEWVCQLLYHPWKRVGFGFTNGEGAEWFWNSICHLIAHLRICGYHNRLYTLDAQIIHHQEASLFRLGDWIRQRYHHCLQKRTDATKDLRKSGKPVAFLQEQWKLQVLTRWARQELRHELREKYLRAVEDGDEAAAIESAVEGGGLGVTKHAELQELVKSEYMRLRINARALKLRLRERLRARKFEMDVMECAYRRLMNDSKLHAHTESAVKRREPTSTKIAAEYNKLCGQLAKLIKDGKAPAGSTVPLPIPSKGLWQLEVDDVIFLDVGLDDADDNDGEPPPWLCDEQDARLWRETMALQVWFGEEWQLSREVIERAAAPRQTGPPVRYMDKHLPDFGPEKKALLPPWGPSQRLLSQCRTEAHVAACGEDWHYGVDDDEDEEDEYDKGSSGEEEDFETLDAMERADIYRHDEQDNY